MITSYLSPRNITRLNTENTDIKFSINGVYLSGILDRVSSVMNTGVSYKTTTSSCLLVFSDGRCTLFASNRSNEYFIFLQVITDSDIVGDGILPVDITIMKGISATRGTLTFSYVNGTLSFDDSNPGNKSSYYGRGITLPALDRDILDKYTMILARASGGTSVTVYPDIFVALKKSMVASSLKNVAVTDATVPIIRYISIEGQVISVVSSDEVHAVCSKFKLPPKYFESKVHLDLALYDEQSVLLNRFVATDNSKILIRDNDGILVFEANDFIFVTSKIQYDIDNVGRVTKLMASDNPDRRLLASAIFNRSTLLNTYTNVSVLYEEGVKLRINIAVDGLICKLNSKFGEIGSKIKAATKGEASITLDPKMFFDILTVAPQGDYKLSIYAYQYVDGETEVTNHLFRLTLLTEPDKHRLIYFGAGLQQ